MKSEEIEAVTGNVIADQILDLVRRRKGVSFVELERIEGFGGGSMELSISAYNIVLWQGLTEAAVEALQMLRERKLIHMVPTSVLIYLCDGRIPGLPMAKKARPYKKPHWAPVVFNPGPDPEPRFNRRSRRAATPAPGGNV